MSGRGIFETWSEPSSTYLRPKQSNVGELEELRKEIKVLNGKIDQTDIWCKHLDELYKKIYESQESAIDKKIGKALDLYESDKIGLFDYASIYARGLIHSTPYTIPSPINRTITILNLLKINVLSNPENLIDPNNMPGNCFAFLGTQGCIRIKLGKKIFVRAITVDHTRLYGEKGTAPKDFKVYGFEDPNNDFSGTLLGSFKYDIDGTLTQTFPIDKNLAFQYVELRVLNNYGNEKFTCVYRFRVHDSFVTN